MNSDSQQIAVSNQNRRRFLQTLMAAPLAVSALGAAPIADITPAVEVAKKIVIPPVLCQVHGAGQVGSSIQVSPLAERMTVGDMFFIETVGTVRNPAMPAKVKTIFVVTEEADAGYSEIRMYPPLIPSGQFQNVNKSPDNGCIIRRYVLGMGIEL